MSEQNRTPQDILQLESFIDRKLQLLSSARSREDRELIEMQISDLQKRRQELASLLAEHAEENCRSVA